MASRKCPDCGMAHDRPRYQATPSTDVVDRIGCALGVVQSLAILFMVVAFLWAIFLLWPV